MNIGQEVSSGNVTKRLEGIKPALTAIDPPQDWTTKKDLELSYARIVLTFDNDLKALKKTAGFIFEREHKSFTNNMESLLRLWQIQEKEAPSIASICVYAIEHFQIPLTHQYIDAVMLLSILSSVSKDLAYHNAMHYRKVVLQTICLIDAHNEIYAGTTKVLNHDQILIMLMAACGHDLGHDGLGNTIKGVFQPSRLESFSVNLIYQYLSILGLADENVMEALRVMILSTDITPVGDPTSPANQVKAAYEFHFLETKNQLDQLNLDKDLKPLEKSPSLTRMAMMIHEADIATSAGVTYPITQYETSLLCEEIGNEKARPEHVLTFLNMICNRRMVSQAAQKLYASSMARIMALAEEDFNSGNEAYPDSKQSYFLNPYHSSEGTDKKTIN